MPRLRRKIIQNDIKQLNRKIEEIDIMTSNPAKMYKAIQNVYKMKKPTLVITTDSGITTDENIVTGKITKYFIQLFTNINHESLPSPEA